MVTDEPKAPWDEVWELLLVEQDELRRVANAIDFSDADDLVHSFALEQLPRILPRTRGLAPERRGAYVRAAFRNYVRTGLRTTKRNTTALKRLSLELEAREEVPDIERIPQPAFARALDSIDSELARFLGLHLGVAGPARSIRDLAREFGVSRYRARQLILDGFLAMAAALGRHGALSQEELAVCRQLLVRGRDVEETGQRLGMTAYQVKSALSRARTIVSTYLV